MLAHIGKKLLQGRTVERGAGEPAIIMRSGIKRQPSWAWLLM
jgi:hypothetical protein